MLQAGALVIMRPLTCGLFCSSAALRPSLAADQPFSEAAIFHRRPTSRLFDYVRAVAECGWSNLGNL